MLVVRFDYNKTASPHFPSLHIVTTSDGKGVEWIEQTSAGEVRHSSTPGARPSRVFFVNLMRLLPIEWLL